MTRTRLLTLVLMLATGTAADAMPRFAARTGMPCSACHVNPSGAGMRGRFGANVYATRFLPLPRSTDAASEALLSPEPIRGLAFGTDIRPMWLSSMPAENDAPATRKIEEQHSFFLMQADLYVRAQPAEWVTFYHDQGVYGAFESMVLLTFGPVTIKTGQYVPPYGWKLPNHMAWTRELLGLTATDRDVGVEVDLELGPLSLQAATVNGAGDDLFDDNFLKGVSMRFDLRFGQRAVRGRVGGSFYYNQAGEESDEGDQRREVIRAGGLYALHVGRLGLLGEVDYVRLDDRSTPMIRGQLIGYHELTFLAWQGVDIRFTYEHFDDVEVEDDMLHRLGVGVEVFPIHGLELQVLARTVLGDRRMPEAGLTDFLAMVHVYY